MPMFVRPRPLALFFFVAALATTVGLGTWQVQRLQWKKALIAEIEAAQKETPITGEALPNDAAALDALNFRPICLSGMWQQQEFDITPRFFNGVLGYFIVQPFVLADQRIVLINRGWVPAEKKDPQTRLETMTPMGRMVEVCGMIRFGDERNWATPPNDPKRNLWFGRDVAQMAASAGLANTVPAMVDLVGTQDAKQLPVPSDGKVRLRNDHLSYILTWYGIALGILVIFLTYHRKKR